MDENDRGMGTWRIYLVLDSARVRPPVRPRHLALFVFLYHSIAHNSREKNLTCMEY